jgi:hypothetical protein
MAQHDGVLLRTVKIYRQFMRYFRPEELPLASPSAVDWWHYGVSRRFAKSFSSLSWTMRTQVVALRWE